MFASAMVRRVVGRCRRLFIGPLGVMFIGWLGVLAVRIFVVRLRAVGVARLGLSLRQVRAAQARVTAFQLHSAVVAHAVELELLLGFQGATSDRVFTLSLPALGQCLVLVFVQAVDLVVEIVF